MSCGWWLVPRMMIRSLMRPTTKTSSSLMKPRSPLRRNGPSPESAIVARKVRRVSSGAPNSRGSPPDRRSRSRRLRSAAQRLCVSGSTMTILVVGKIWPQPTTARSGPRPWPASTIRCSSRASASSCTTTGSSSSGLDDTIRTDLGQPVARAERGPAEPVRAEPGCERVQDLGVDQLGGIAGGPPGRKVEPLALFGADPAAHKS